MSKETEEFLDEVLIDMYGGDHSDCDDSCPEKYKRTQCKQAILQHFQQEQERAVLQARVDEMEWVQEAGSLTNHCDDRQYQIEKSDYRLHLREIKDTHRCRECGRLYHGMFEICPNRLGGKV